MGLSALPQVNSVNCNTSWKINLFMQFRDHMDEVLKGVRSWSTLQPLPRHCLTIPALYPALLAIWPFPPCTPCSGSLRPHRGPPTSPNLTSPSLVSGLIISLSKFWLFSVCSLAKGVSVD